VPLRVLTHGDADWDQAYSDRRMERVWTDMLGEMAAALGALPPTVVPHGGHEIVLDPPDAVVAAVA
jgi:hypothetical protein